MDQSSRNNLQSNTDPKPSSMAVGISNAPDLRQDSPAQRGIKISNRTLSPLRTKSVPTSPNLQTGSPERREKIQQLQMQSLKRNLATSPEQRSGLEQADDGPKSIEFRPRKLTYTSPEKPSKSPKKARFADIDPDTTLVGAVPKSDSESERSVVEALERISNTLTATAVALRDVKETQRELVEEIQDLRRKVEQLEKKASRP